MRRRIGADPGEGEQPRGDLVVRKVVGIGGRELLQVDLAEATDSARERR